MARKVQVDARTHDLARLMAALGEFNDNSIRLLADSLETRLRTGKFPPQPPELRIAPGWKPPRASA